MSYLHVVLLVVLLALAVFSWFIAVSGVRYWLNHLRAWSLFETFVWWIVFAVAVASTAGALVLL